MINFSLSNFLENAQLNNKLYNLARYESKYFLFPNITISSEGAIPFCYWSASNCNNLKGAPVLGERELNQCDWITVKSIDFGNPNLLSSDTFDTAGNFYANYFNDGSNRIIVNTPMMAQYFHENYPDYYLIAGPLYPRYDEDKEYIDLFRYFKMARSTEWYSDIPKEKIEVCAFSYCSHCDKWEQCMLQNSIYSSMFSEQNCFISCGKQQDPRMNENTILEYIKQGYQNFYFDTEAFNPNNIRPFVEMYLAAMVKPEYYNEVRGILLNG